MVNLTISEIDAVVERVAREDAIWRALPLNYELLVRGKLAKSAGPQGRVTVADAVALGFGRHEISVVVAAIAADNPAVARSLRLWMADTAEEALPIFESRRPDDGRVRAAISTARRFAEGAADDAERVAARRAAGEASRGLEGPAHHAAVAAAACCAKAEGGSMERAMHVVAFRAAIAGGEDERGREIYRGAIADAERRQMDGLAGRLAE